MLPDAPVLSGIAPFVIPAAISVGSWLLGKMTGGKKEPDKTAGDEELNLLRQSSQESGNLADQFQSQSSQTVGPVINYLKNILGANPGGVMDATKAERGRVIDQYDTARKALVNFGPRGGGSASAMGETEIAKGNQVSDILASARGQAYEQAGDLGTRLSGLGLTAQNLASQDLSTVLQTILTREGFDVQKRGQNMEAATSAGEALGTLLGTILLGKKA